MLVKQYRDAFKNRIVRRLVGPAARSANAVAAEIGVSQSTLSRWLVAAVRNVGDAEEAALLSGDSNR